MMGWDTFFYFMIASMVISYAITPKAKNNDATAAKFEDFDFPQTDEGTPQCVVFGDCWVSDWTVIGLGNFRTEPIKSGGGKK